MSLARTKATPIFVFGTVAMLTLAGCSSPDASAESSASSKEKTKTAQPDDGVVFDFSEINGIPAAKKITFEIPTELLEADTAYAEDRVLTSVTASSRELDSAEFCAVDLAYTWADGALDRTLNSEWYNRFGEAETKTANQKMFTALGYGGNLSQASEPDMDNLETGTYVSEDAQTATVITECASGPTDGDTGQVSFRQFKDVDDGTVDYRTLASAGLAVMKNGDLYVASSDVTGWAPDMNGTWIKD